MQKNNPKKPPNNIVVKVYLGYEYIWVLSGALQLSLLKAVINLRSLGKHFSGIKLSGCSFADAGDLWHLKWSKESFLFNLTVGICLEISKLFLWTKLGRS